MRSSPPTIRSPPSTSSVVVGGPAMRPTSSDTPVERVVRRPRARPRRRRGPRPRARCSSRARVELGADGSLTWSGTGPARRTLERAIESPAPDTGPPPRPATGRAAWTGSTTSTAYARSRADPRRRVLPGEPHPPARRPAAARCGRAVRRRSVTGNPAPHAAVLRAWADAAGRRPRSSPRRPSASSASTADARRDPSDQGHRGDARRGCAPARRTAPRT